MANDLIEKVRLWIAHDPDPETRRELEALLQHHDYQELKERFHDRLQFGTAGLRGKIGAGPLRFNLSVVIQTTDGLARYLLESVKISPEQGIVIGYDARRLSEASAREAARVLGGHGIKVYLFPTLVPTPLLAYAVLNLNTVAGIMITASHNPKGYNGYKIFWENGAQLLSPHDRAIAEYIATATFADQVFRPDLEQLENEQNLLIRLDESIAEAYIKDVLSQRLYPHMSGTSVNALYTPLHGVGYPLFKKIIQKAGYSGVQVVVTQADPDGEFPTLTIPNPEDKSTLAEAMKQAKDSEIELILANDPDADRLAVCLRDRDDSFHILTGDEIGILLADYLFTGLKATQRLPPRPMVLTTVVSSRLLAKLAETNQIHYEETLTGFKWINNRAITLESQGYQFLFGYEEALGYCIGPVVRDKDGLSAALLFLEMASWFKHRGKTLLDHLLALYQRFGLFYTHQESIEFSESDSEQATEDLMERLREKSPEIIADQPVHSVCDYLQRQRRHAGRSKTTPLLLPKTNMLAFELAAGDRILVRPSGTEPKIKIYFETIIPGENIKELSQGRALAIEKTALLAGAFKDFFKDLMIICD